MAFYISGVAIANPGTGYSNNGLVQVVGGAGLPGFLTFSAGGGVVTGVGLAVGSGGAYTTLPPNPVATIGAGNNDFTATCTFSAILIPTGYATANDFLNYFDLRTTGELLDDTGNPVVDIGASSILQELLLSASGQVAAACEVSGLYSSADLTAISQSTDPSSAWLRRIVCTLAGVMLVQRRYDKLNSDYWTEREKWCEDYLDRLRTGQRLFITAQGDVVGAGQPSVDGPSSVDYARLNLLPDRVQNFYPNRAQRLPWGR